MLLTTSIGTKKRKTTFDELIVDDIYALRRNLYDDTSDTLGFETSKECL